jgi:hypothetical protein
MNGQLLASLILGLFAVGLGGWALLDRLQQGQWTSAARTRLRIALIFLIVAAWLTWLRLGGAPGP